RTKEAIVELEAAGHALEPRGRFNGVWAPWAGDLAEEDPARAAQLATTARVHAERFGTDTAIGEALRGVSLFARPEDATHLLAESVRHLEASPSAYEHALALVDHGIAIRSPRELARAHKLATACGAESLANRAHQARASIRSSE
ncbi:ATP-binding protein, partial [Streptomyces sp. NPDC057748]